MLDQADALLAAGKWDEDEPPCKFCKEVLSKCHCRRDLVTREAVERGIEK